MLTCFYNKKIPNKIKPSFGFFSKAILGFISGSISAPMGITGAMMNVPILRFFGYPITKAIISISDNGKNKKKFENKIFISICYNLKKTREKEKIKLEKKMKIEKKLKKSEMKKRELKKKSLIK